MSENFQEYNKQLAELQKEKNSLEKKLKKIKNKIKEIGLIVNPPWWTKLDDELKIFQGLIKDIKNDKKYDVEYGPRYLVKTTIYFTNKSSLSFELCDEYGDGDVVSVYIDDESNFKKMYKSLADLLSHLNIEKSKENMLLLLELLEKAADVGSYFETELDELYGLFEE